MPNVSKHYEKVFDKLYRSGVYHLHTNFDTLASNEKHYAFEVTRRFLDICRIINKHWPNTAKYIVAINGDTILEQIYARIFNRSEETSTLKEAALASLKQVLIEVDDKVSSLLLDFEHHVAQGKNINFLYDSLPLSPNVSVLFKAEFDFLNFYHTVDYYKRTSSPAILFKHIKLINQVTYATFSA